MRVLYVDDEPDITEIALFALSLDPALDVRSAPNGTAALSIIAEWMPDIVLLDVMMPGLDGPATLARLREIPEAANLPVVFITARPQPEEIRDFALLKTTGIIPKPFNPMTLAQQVRAFLA